MWRCHSRWGWGHSWAPPWSSAWHSQQGCRWPPPPPARWLCSCCTRTARRSSEHQSTQQHLRSVFWLVTHDCHIHGSQPHRPISMRMYLWWSLCTLYSCTLYLLACQVRVTIGDSCLCCCVCVTSFDIFWVLISSLACWFFSSQDRQM